MKIKSIQTHYVRIPFDMGAPRQDFAGLRHCFINRGGGLIDFETLLDCPHFNSFFNGLKVQRWVQAACLRDDTIGASALAAAA